MSDTLVSSTYVYVHDNAQATATQISRATAAFSAFTTSSIDALVDSRVDIYFTTPADMARIPGLTSAAWGFTPRGTRICHVNSTLNAAQTKYVCVHELFHIVDRDKLSPSDRDSLMAIMTRAATSNWNEDDGTSGNTAYRHHPSECFADQGVAAYTTGFGEAPLQAASGGDYYYRQIDSSDYGTYRSIVGGGAGPTAITLTSDAFFLDTTINVSAVTGLGTGDWLLITGTDPEQVQIDAISGSGPYAVDIDSPLGHNHASGTTVLEVGPPSDPGGPSDRLDTAIGLAGSVYTSQISADSIKATESGSEFNGTFTFTIRVDPNSDTDQGFDDSYPWADVYWTFDGNVLFGGVFMGATRRHGVAGDVYYDCRCVSYDSWLDRRSRPAWWTTDDGTPLGTPIDSDGEMVETLIAYAAPFLDTSLVAVTKTGMPLLDLPDGTVRSHIERIAEAAGSDGDAVRRAYVDFDQVVHYFSGSEGTSAPYSITDQPSVESPVFLIPDDIEFDTDFNDSGSQVYVNGTGINDWVSFDGAGPYVANTIIDRPEVTDSDELNAAGVGFLTTDFMPKYMVKFTVQGYHGWRAGQTVTVLNNGLSIAGDYEIRSIDVTPSPGGNDQITYEIAAGAAPWRGTLDLQRK